MDKQYKPFNLERALAGDKFARRCDMKEPQEWHYFKTDPNKRPVICIFEGDVCWFSTSGDAWPDQQPSDLVMLPKTKKMYIAVDEAAYCSSDDFQQYCSNAFPDKRSLLAWIDRNRAGIHNQIIEIEVDE